jgi:hypothetical protein
MCKSQRLLEILPAVSPGLGWQEKSTNDIVIYGLSVFSVQLRKLLVCATAGQSDGGTALPQAFPQVK